MGALVALLTSPPVLKAIKTLVLVAFQFMTGVDAGAPGVKWGDKLVLERVENHVVVDLAYQCWKVREVPEDAVAPIADIFGIAEALVIQDAVLCREVGDGGVAVIGPEE